MAPLIPIAKTTLSYPLYACDFDPFDDSRLVVGGGGGAGQNGVGNKITVLDTSNASEIEEVTEVVLSKKEDNVTSLAVGQRKGKSTLVFAGANSSPKDVEDGKNLHFRVLGIEAAAKGKGKGKGKAKIDEKKASTSNIIELSRASLFAGTGKDLYQRILRLSRPHKSQLGQPQVGAIATGLVQDSEIVLFDTSTINPPKSRGSMKGGKECADVDFLQTGDDEYMLAYCDIYDIYIKKISPGTDAEKPECVYITPASRSNEKVTLPSFRALRWLTKEFILMLTNVHGNHGVVLQILRLPPSGTGQCRLAQSIRLTDRLTKATGLAVANLTPPISPSAPQDYTQFVVAVAGQDNSISLFKIDLQIELGISLITSPYLFRTLLKVHPHQITGLAFSNFTPPELPITAATPRQHLKLASIGVSNTVVVHTLPLFPVPLSMKRGQSQTPRYVVALPSSTVATGFSAFFSIIGILIATLLVQSVLEIRGIGPVWLNAREHVPLRIQEAIGRPYSFPEGYNIIPTSVLSSKVPEATGHKHLGVPLPEGSALRLPEIFSSLQNPENTETSPTFFIQEHESESGIKAHLHDGEVHKGDKWEDLEHEKKEKWLKKLKDAGYWAEDMGETMLKGVVFGELGGMVGQVAAQALGG